MISKSEVINNLYNLVADVNAEEIASHIKFESLQDWSDTWRCRAKELLMMLEDESMGVNNG